MGRNIVENTNKTHLALIKSFLKVINRLEERATNKKLEKKENNWLQDKVVCCYICTELFWEAEDMYQHCDAPGDSMICSTTRFEERFVYKCVK
ncbi:hypothetical protein CWI38_0312p0040 [Hamiltosporidium tvaerminnensis]|uniref:Uncharacterized protein n=1 Tax=Hamiltosporidium tvaerminnensis TaxID=1176355 RepID=A0A4Q9LZL8_9MICR|nr:hypothetical protein CWI38_0312p0040 [Hamiltosporidium tvaerminnensis]